MLLDDEHRGPPLGGGGPYRLEQPLRDERRQPEGQLVGEQRCRASQDGATQREHLLFPAAQQAAPGVHDVPEFREQLDDVLLGNPRAPQVVPG
jgi:hypothetical protein